MVAHGCLGFTNTFALQPVNEKCSYFSWQPQHQATTDCLLAIYTAALKVAALDAAYVVPP